MSRGKVIGLIVVLIVVALGFRAYQKNSAAKTATSDDAPVPVSAAAATRSDVPIVLEALGTVQALNTVTMRPQVGGQIEAIGFAEGQAIRKDAVIARIDSRPYQAQLEQAIAKKRQDQAQLDSASDTLQRYEDLIQKGYVSTQDRGNQRHTVAQFQALVAADQAAISNAQVSLDYTTLRAPIDGIAGIRQVDVGNVVQAGQTGGIVVLTQVQPINVLFTLPEQTLEQVRATQKDTAQLSVQALDRNDHHPVAQGTLKVVDNQIDSSTGTFKLKAQFDNTDNALWPGQFTNVRLELRVQSGLVIPVQAVQRGPDGSYVYLVQNDNTVAVQPISALVETADGRVMVGTGLSEGQRVVTEGQFRLKPGTKVSVVAPASSKVDTK
jgi:multidrug efflux system membrane fusion protein